MILLDNMLWTNNPNIHMENTGTILRLPSLRCSAYIWSATLVLLQSSLQIAAPQLYHDLSIYLTSISLLHQQINNLNSVSSTTQQSSHYLPSTPCYWEVVYSILNRFNLFPEQLSATFKLASPFLYFRYHRKYLNLN